MRIVFTALLMALSFMLLAPLAAAQDASVAPTQKTEIEKIVHDYLIAHPEVIKEAIEALQAKEDQTKADAQTQTVLQNKDALYNDPETPVAGNPVGDFNIHNGWAGAEARLSPNVNAFAALGISRVGVNAFGPPKTGPAWRGGLNYTHRLTNLGVTYSRSFVPSYSFGGTLQNEDVTTRVRQTFSRRVAGQASELF